MNRTTRDTWRRTLAVAALVSLIADAPARAAATLDVAPTAATTPEAAIRLEWRIFESEISSRLRKAGIDLGGVRTRGEDGEPDLSATFTGAAELLAATTAFGGGVQERATSRLSGDALSDAVKDLGKLPTGGTTTTDAGTSKTGTTSDATTKIGTVSDSTTKIGTVSDSTTKIGTVSDSTTKIGTTTDATRTPPPPTATDIVRTDDVSRIQDAISNTGKLPIPSGTDATSGKTAEETRTDTPILDRTRLPEGTKIDDPRITDRLKDATGGADDSRTGGTAPSSETIRVPDTTRIVTDPKIEFIGKTSPDKPGTGTEIPTPARPTRPDFVPGTTPTPTKTGETGSGTKDDPRSGVRPGGDVRIETPTSGTGGTKVPVPDTTRPGAGTIGKPGTRIDDALPGDPRRPPPGSASPAEPPAVQAPFRIHVERTAEGGRTVDLTARAPLAPIIVGGKGLPRALIGSFIDNDVERGTTYRYRLKFTDEKGSKVLATTDEVVAVAHDGLPPAAVRDPRAVPGVTEIALEWTPLDDPEVSAYRIYRVDADVRRDLVPRLLGGGGKTVRRGRAGGGSPKVGLPGAPDDTRTGRVGEVAAARAGRFVDKSVEPGRSYGYVVVAFDPFDGEGAESPAVVAETLDVTPPAPPASAAASAGEGGVVDVSWTAGPSGDVVRHHVYRVIGSEEDGLRIAAVERSGSPADRARDFLNPRSQYVYRYRVTAVDAAGNESAPTTSGPVRLPDIVPPRPPAIADARGEDRAVVLSWMAPPDDDVAGYRVYRSAGDGAAPTVLADGIAARTHRDAGLAVGATFTWWVTAVDGAGLESEPSRAIALRVTGTIDRTPPADVRVRADADGHPRVEWAPLDGAVDVVYVVFRGSTSAGLFEPVSGALRETTFSDRGRREGAASFYRVVARHADGTLSEPSEAVPFAVAVRPGLPSGPSDTGRSQ